MTPLNTVDNMMEQHQKNTSATTSNGTVKPKNGDANPQSPPRNQSISQSNGSKAVTTKNNTQDDYNDQQYAPYLQKQDSDQAVVQTPYGPGLVIRTHRRPSTSVVRRDIELTDWTTQAATTAATTRTKGKPPKKPVMLYSSMDFPSVPPQRGDDVLCGKFGRGKVIEVLAETQQVKVQLSSWRLAGRSRVMCTMQQSDLQVVRPKLVYEMTTVFEKVEHAQALKDDAKTLFAQKLYERALTKYALAVDAVRYVQHDGQSTNYVRADLLLIMMTCCNNAATCAMHQPPPPAAASSSSSHTQNKWDLVLKYAKNALVLIEALEDRQQSSSSSSSKPSKVYQIILEEPGMTATKLFGEWKGKSLLLLARAYTEKQQYDAALDACQQVHACVSQYWVVDDNNNNNNNNKILQQHQKDLERIKTNCQHYKKMELKKEKQRAQAMFGGNANSATNKKSSPPAKTSSKSRDDNADDPKSTSSTNTIPAVPAPARRLDSNNYSMDSSSKRNNNNLRVTFEDGGTPRDAYIKPSRTVSLSDDNDYDDDDYPELPWYQEHQELLMLTTGVAVLGLGVTQLVRLATSSRR